MRPDPARRCIRFGAWLDTYGLQRLAEGLHAHGLPLMTMRAVQHWQAGRALPRIEAVAVIEDLSGGHVRMADIIEHRDAMRAARIETTRPAGVPSAHGTRTG